MFCLILEWMILICGNYACFVLIFPNFARTIEQMAFRMKELDDIDLDILRALRYNGRLSVRELAAKVHRSPTPVFERLRRLESEGIIKGYTVELNMDKIGRGFTVFCNVRLKHINTDIHIEFAREGGDYKI